MSQQMQLYNLTLQQPSAIHTSCYGTFSEPKKDEIVIARGSVLEIYRVDLTLEGQPDSLSFQLIASRNTFSFIRCLAAYKEEDDALDKLIVTSDSGSVVMLEFDITAKEWKRISMMTIGKHGVRRITPGQYIATFRGAYRKDSFMVASVEKQKFVFPVSKPPRGLGGGVGEEKKLSLKSPLEAHKNHVIVWSVVAVEDDGPNAIYATLECEYNDKDPSYQPSKQVVFYELNSGGNHVTRNQSIPVDRRANLLFPAPGGTVHDNKRPGGVFVCQENYVTWLNSDGSMVSAAIPRRQGQTESVLMVSGTLIVGPKSRWWFYLIQSEHGDVYKVTLDLVNESSAVSQINIYYFDTLPVANALYWATHTRSLICLSETATHRLYKVDHLGDDQTSYILGTFCALNADGIEEQFPVFAHRELSNVRLVYEMLNISPLLDLKVLNFGGDSATVVGVGGRSTQGSLIHFRRELLAQETTTILEHPPARVWSVRPFLENCDKYLVFAYENATRVLTYDKGSLQLAADNTFDANAKTLLLGALVDDVVVQIQPDKICLISPNKSKKWKSPATITGAAVNPRQVLISLNSTFKYFDDTHGFSERSSVDVGADIQALDIAPLPEGKAIALHLAVATGTKVYVFSLRDPNSPTQIEVITLETNVSALCFAYHASEVGEGRLSLNLYIGLLNGVVERRVVEDRMTYKVSSRKCGTSPVRLCASKISKFESAVVIMSSTTWLSYYVGSSYQISPLCRDVLDDATQFATKTAPYGIMALTKNTIKHIEFPKPTQHGDTFKPIRVPLTLTPRKVVQYPNSSFLIITESDHHACTDTQKEQIRESMTIERVPPEREYGTLRRGRGTWASYVRLYDLSEDKVLDLVELPDDGNFSIVSLAIITKDTSTHYIAVGAVKDLQLNPKSYSHGVIFIFQRNGFRLDVVHQTAISGIPHCITGFGETGNLLVGCNNALRMYAIGKTQLLLQCEKADFPTTIVSLATMKERVYVSDGNESVHFVKYKAKKNVFAVFADEPCPRWVSAMCVVDYNTVAVGDKFGNIAVLRLPPGTSEDLDDDPTLDRESDTRWIYERLGDLNTAAQHAEAIAQYYIGDIVTSIQKTRLTKEGPEVILYSTIGGLIGCMQPLETTGEVQHVRLLQQALRNRRFEKTALELAHPTIETNTREKTLLGRDHMDYRSSYYPTSGVVDGDFVEGFLGLERSHQEFIAERMGTKVETLQR
eukprot:PhF_6_TR44274/c0_g1_i2/m.68218/K12830/SF3B3, SAP130, RSE1; splicing factor 3B subunit 3